ncbi:MAG TPA: hypothetical protein VFY29_21130 [Terriglobia bacterium]|nr:hypothetical protein [Terriglobia bacterium]
MKYVLRTLVFAHRWVGIVLCLVFLLWFPSGIGMMYWTFPEVGAEDRLEHSPKLDPAQIILSPEEAAETLDLQATPGGVRLNSFDGRPVYRFGEGGRGGGAARIVYADTGEEQTEVSTEMLDRIASSWTDRPSQTARKESVEEPDQWTVAGQLRNLRPMYKYSWPDGQQVYLNGATGEVVQYTTFASRMAAHISAIPHWLYYTPLRQNQPFWINFMIYASMIGTIGSIIGMIVAVWMYSPKKRYRLAGNPTGVPYRGQKRWHWIFGMVFGVATITWTFSGMMSLGPFPLVERLTGSNRADGRGGGRSGAQQGIAGALRGRVRMTDFASVHPGDVLARVPNLDVRELEWTSFNGTPIFSAKLSGGKNRLLSLDGAEIDGFDQEKVIEIIKGAVPDPDAIEIRPIDEYDLYYFDRTRQRPLPVLLVLMNDADHTRHYVDPKSARVLTTYSSRNWVNRWLYSALHSLNFPFLYNHRPLWDIVVITFMVGGTALCVTSLVLGWRVLGRKLKRAAVTDVLTAEPS